MFGYLTWQQRVGQNETYSGYFPENGFWTQAYKKINIANNILNSLKDVPKSSDAEREGTAKVEGETRFLRAYYYLTLVSLYGQPYDPATADRQPGVPLKTSPEVEDVKWQRNTVAEVFSLIESDLLQAEEAFNSVSHEKKSIYRADQTAVRLLLSRVYLYMQQWQKAAQYARLVIDSHGQLCDLRTYREPMMMKDNVENIFSMGGDDLPAMMSYQAQGLRISNSQYNSYENNDLRRSRWIWKSGAFQGIAMQEDASSSFTEPLDTTASNYYYYAYTGYQMGKELPVSSLFWLRSATALETRRFVLTEDAPSWTQPIPQEVLDFNTGMENNGNLWREYTLVPTDL